MSERMLEADYVVVGAGAVGMAFVDTMLDYSDASIIVIDRRHKPGGLWNDAYSFVRLHGPSAYYGVNSEQLGSDRIEEVGHNKGLYELATGAELAAYFDRVMRQKMLPSGRVTYLPLSEYKDGVATSLANGEKIRVRAKRRLVDATYADTRQPSTHAPNFTAADVVRLITPNTLPQNVEADANYAVIGSGKTAMDTVTWLLDQGVTPEQITWVRPRDAWVLNRKNVQPKYDFFEQIFTARAMEMEAARDCTSLDDLFLRLEAAGVLQRFDKNVMPTMFRCSICSEAEVEQLRRVTNVIRMGHIKWIGRDRMVMDKGTVSMPVNTIYINCTADGIPDRPSQPIYQDKKIVLQYVRRCSPTFSGAFVAHLEAAIPDDAVKNSMCTPVPPPKDPIDWIRMQLQEAGNQSAWAKTPALQPWLMSSRLERFAALVARAYEENNKPNLAALARYRAAAKAGLARLAELMGEQTHKKAA
jgi:choline dehydrogenase-like flavoprotein